MKALVYHGPVKKAQEEKQKPTIIVSTDVVVKILKTTICGTEKEKALKVILTS